MSDPPLPLPERLRDEVGQLTRLRPDEFVAARTARAKALKAAGEAELAKTLASIRRPTVPAWALDQLGHQHADDLDALFSAADAVRVTQSTDEPDRGAVREVTRAFTSQVRTLRAYAADLLRAAGIGPDPHLDEVEATLLAAASDGEVAADLRAGALSRPAPSPGFTALADLAPPITGPRRSRRAPARASDGAGNVDGADEDRDGDEVDGDTSVEEARRAERERRRDELTAERDDLRSRAERAGEDASTAREEATELRARADDAVAVAERAEHERDELAATADRMAEEFTELADDPAHLRTARRGRG